MVWDDQATEHRWLSLGITGLSPYWVEWGAWLWLDTQGNSQLQIDAEYEARLTQDWALYPAAQLTGYGQDRPHLQQWQGLAQMDLSLRLAYQRHRWLAPYVGVSYERPLGQTAKHLTNTTSEWQGILGMRFWY